MEDYFKKITQYYKPAEPIKDASLFVGRAREQSSVYKSLIAPGKYPVIFGVRGIGKTSLINIACDYFCAQNDYKRIRHGCSSTDNFYTIFNTFLRNLDANFSPSSFTQKDSTDISGGVKIPLIEVNTKESTNIETTYQPLTNTLLSPTIIAEKFKDQKCILIIDELDQIKKSEDIGLIADTIKALSDSNASTKLLLSGVSNSLIQLVGEHQSVLRNLVAIELPRMTNEELIKIIENGATKLKINFHKDVIKNIVWLSDGLPYFTHLISECLADSAFYLNKKNIDFDDMIGVLNSVIDNMAMQEAVRTNYENTYNPQRFWLLKDTDPFGQAAKNYSVLAKQTVLNILSTIDSRDKEYLEKIYFQYKDMCEIQKSLDNIDHIDIQHILEIFTRSTDMIYENEGYFYFKDSFHKVYTRIESLRQLSGFGPKK